MTLLTPQDHRNFMTATIVIKTQLASGNSQLKKKSAGFAGGFLISLSGILLEDYDAGGLQAFLAGFNSELHFLTFFERAEAVALDG